MTRRSLLRKRNSWRKRDQPARLRARRQLSLVEVNQKVEDVDGADGVGPHDGPSGSELGEARQVPPVCFDRGRGQLALDAKVVQELLDPHVQAGCHPPMVGRDARARKFLPRRGRFDRRSRLSSCVPPGRQRERDRRQHGVCLHQHLVGGETQHGDAAGAEKLRAPAVAPARIRMKVLPAVDLDRQPARGAEESQIERAAGMMPAKLVAGQPTAAQVRPE